MPTQITNLILVICSILSVSVGIKILLTKDKSFSDTILAFVMFFVSIWSLAIDFTTVQIQVSASVFLFSSAVMAMSLVLLYVLSFASFFDKKKNLLAVLIPAIVVAIITMIPHTTLTSVERIDNHVISKYGPFFLLYNLAIITYAVLIGVYYRKILPHLRENLRIQLKYTIISLSIAGIFTLFATIILPSSGISDFVYFGPLSMLFLVAGISYGLSRHRLLGAQVIASELLSITLVLVVLVWLVVNFSIFNFALFACVIIISFLFIRSSILAAEERLVIEKKEQQLQKDKIELQSLDKLKDEFIMMATHELSTPLSIIQAKLSMVFDEKAYVLSDKDKDFLKPIYLSSKRATVLFSKIIQIVNLESSNFALIKEKSDFIALTKQSIKYAGELARIKNIQIVASLPSSDSLEKLAIDEKKIKQVVDSMIDNAIVFSNPDSKIELDVKVEKENVIFSITDNGRGISSEDKVHIYEKFYQMDRFDEKNPTEQQGSGLSLFIDKRIIELHGGKTWFESEPDKGSTFYFSLPLD